MIPVAPNGAATVPDAVQCARCAARQSIESAAEVVARVGLDKKVHVVGLHRKMQDAECVSGRASERLE
jgi:hypothetical protein